MSRKLPSIGSVADLEVPWYLPVVDPCGKCETQEVHYNIIKDALKSSPLYQIPPCNRIFLPWPWSLFDFVLLEDLPFISVKDPVKRI